MVCLALLAGLLLSGCGSSAACTAGNIFLGGAGGTIIVENASFRGTPGIILGIDIASPFHGVEEHRVDLRPRDRESFEVSPGFYDVTLHWAGGHASFHTIDIDELECATVHGLG